MSFFGTSEKPVMSGVFSGKLTLPRATILAIAADLWKYRTRQGGLKATLFMWSEYF
jgi:hypothetical protein